MFAAYLENLGDHKSFERGIIQELNKVSSPKSASYNQKVNDLEQEKGFWKARDEKWVLQRYLWEKKVLDADKAEFEKARVEKIKKLELEIDHWRSREGRYLFFLMASAAVVKVSLKHRPSFPRR